MYRPPIQISPSSSSSSKVTIRSSSFTSTHLANSVIWPVTAVLKSYFSSSLHALVVYQPANTFFSLVMGASGSAALPPAFTTCASTFVASTPLRSNVTVYTVSAFLTQPAYSVNPVSTGVLKSYSMVHALSLNQPVNL